MSFFSKRLKECLKGNIKYYLVVDLNQNVEVFGFELHEKFVVDYVDVALVAVHHEHYNYYNQPQQAQRIINMYITSSINHLSTQILNKMWQVKQNMQKGNNKGTSLKPGNQRLPHLEYLLQFNLIRIVQGKKVSVGQDNHKQDVRKYHDTIR